MSQPYVGEIRMFGGSFAPVGWMFCDGATLAISENETLFQLIGTTYGGDGQRTFNLPDLRGRVPIHMGTRAGTTYSLAQTAGEESVTLTIQQIPSHTHGFLASNNAASSNSPINQVPGLTQASTITAYGTDNPLVQLSPTSIGSAGGSQPHENLQP